MAGNSRIAEDYTFGQQLGFADLQQLPKGNLGRAVLLNDVNTIGGTEVDLLSISNVTVNPGREVWAYADFNVQNDDTAGFASVALKIYQAGTQIGSRRKLLWANTDFEGVWARARCTQGSGIFTFRVSLVIATGASSPVSVIASAAGPGYLTVNDETVTF